MCAGSRNGLTSSPKDAANNAPRLIGKGSGAWVQHVLQQDILRVVRYVCEQHVGYEPAWTTRSFKDSSLGAERRQTEDAAHLCLRF